MNDILNKVKTEIYDTCGLLLSDLQTEPEGQEYDACRFELDGLKVISRTAKITPKKIGQFVTFWKRNKNGITEPFSENDPVDFFVIHVLKENKLGQFVFPKSVLKNQGILRTDKKDGKRGFRVYPVWDTANNKQAEKTQKWQLDYFFRITDATELDRVKELYTKPTY
ncbi:MepB family protein [Flavobacterium sp. NRK F10]|uniref:MepB family protein n=1 Tax=Flavobacterium sp. NRK F10 TaxID=2954931 RepID=UPI002091DB7C|nr:MepB family protein [Flavobacterium sp. NRK F10]MCO6175978.1 MepB family protein [Flavobacterium sp. NRK F10]